MKALMCVAATCLLTMISGVPRVHAQTQEVGGYTFIKGETGSQVCLGRWIPPAEIGKAGICEGQVLDVGQLTAIAAGQSLDKLDQLILSLSSIDDKMAVSNTQLERLIETETNIMNWLDQQSRQNNEQLRETIIKKFDALARKTPLDASVRGELTRLRDDILKEFERNSTQPTPPTK